MVIDGKSAYHLVDPDLRVEIFFEKEGAAENGGVELKNFLAKPFCFFIVFWRQKIACKSSLDLYCHPLIIASF